MNKRKQVNLAQVSMVVTYLKH